MTDQPPFGTEHFEALQQHGQAAFEQGRLDDSLRCLEEALRWAEKHQDQRRLDLAFCNLTSVQITLKAQDPLDAATLSQLREILMRNDDPVNCRLAAYNLARAYEFRKEPRKGLFYAQIALDRSRQLEREDWLASSHNQIGNFLMAQSFFEQAEAEYTRALALQPESPDDRRAIILTNVGYSCLVRGQYRRGLALLYRSYRQLRRLAAQGVSVKRGLMFVQIDLCYGHLELERFETALRHGRRGLALAEELGEADSIKNALYLLGEASQLSGDEARAREFFSRLAQEFYPTTAGITDFLLAIDVRKMVNLRA